MGFPTASCGVLRGDGPEPVAGIGQARTIRPFDGEDDRAVAHPRDIHHAAALAVVRRQWIVERHSLADASPRQSLEIAFEELPVVFHADPLPTPSGCDHMLDYSMLTMSKEGTTMVDERWFTTRQVADLLQVSEPTVRRWLKSGRLAGINLSGKSGWRVRESEVNAFIDRLEGDEGKAAA